MFGLLALFVRQREEALAELRVEQDRAETLLLNILPRSIADKLKADTATIADQFAAASILFADIVDFTPLSDRLQPAEVVGILDHLFTHFDILAERYGVEKIKTIGDCYMVAAGVPTPREDHARVMALMALDMRDAMTVAGRHRPPGARAADRDQLGAGRRRRHRPQALPVRPVGRRREHGEPDGIPRHARADPGHAGHLRAARRTSSSWSRAARCRSRARATSRRGTWSAVSARRPDTQATALADEPPARCRAWSSSRLLSVDKNLEAILRPELQHQKQVVVIHRTTVRGSLGSVGSWRALAPPPSIRTRAMPYASPVTLAERSRAPRAAA